MPQRGQFCRSSAAALPQLCHGCAAALLPQQQLLQLQLRQQLQQLLLLLLLRVVKLVGLRQL